MISPKSQCALLILGHGSTENPDSSDPTWEAADKIRSMQLFGSVHCAYWKEEPSFRQVFTAIEEREVFAVPNFISEGYFTREVLPRELELDGPVTRRGHHTLYYCDPVGVHPTMTRLIEERAFDLLNSSVSSEDTSLIIVGHGTNLNKQSTEAIKIQVQRIQENHPGRFRSVIDAYMEEAPFISDWEKLTDASHVVVVPFFIADGLHSFQDIPVMLGIETEPTAAASQLSVFKENPIEVHGRKLYYSRAIGTDSRMAEVVLDQVTQFEKAHLDISAP